MGVRKLLFPIALAILWVVMAAMAMVDFATFNATMQGARAAAEAPLQHVQVACGRAAPLAAR